jgi:protein disulfide-isomerase
MLLQTLSRVARSSPAIAACLAFACSCPTFAAPASPWHADLATARAAAAVSSRPVLALFVASWHEPSRQTAAALQADADVNALLSACFEPVTLDVESDPDLARRLEVSHVPTAVVLDAGDHKIAAFECPNAASAFIATAARTARDIAAQTAAAAAATDAGSAASLAAAPHDAPARGSISMLTAKVRQLSNFAADGATPAGSVAAARPIDLHESFASETAPAVHEPMLPQVPPAWNTERPTAPLALTATPPTTTSRPTIEPVAHGAAAAPQTTGASPTWLAPAGTGVQESSASISDMPPTAATPGATATAKPASGLMAAIQKPFAGLVRKPETAAVAKPEPPPTMPPARPQWPGTLAGSAPPAPPAAPAATPAVPGPAAEGTMPLGLEGYCPVTLVEKQVWTEGRPQYGARHRGRTYLFAGPEQQRTFLADPDRYAPALSGDDPVLAFEQGKSMPGQRRYGVVCQSRMYLFTSPATRDAFAANPDKYAGRVALAEQNTTAATRTY